MRQQVTFDPGTVNRIRRRAQKAGHLSGEAEEGWTALGDEPLRLLAAFPALKLRKGLTLRGYRFLSMGNGNAFVHAMREVTPLPEVNECEPDVRHFLHPPVPEEALGHPMEAIDGDDSPRAYLSASLFMRELTELGAMWHGCEWSDHQIVGTSLAAAGSWRWKRRMKPADWRPVVEFGVRMVKVRFHTYCGLGREALYRHEDVYRRGNYVPKTTRTVVALGPEGYIY